MKQTRLYRTWANMKTRCNNKNFHSYKYYGGRGIAVCDEWLRYDEFKEWALNNGYEESLSIDRIDNDGNYEPSNCRWTTRTVQSQNTKCVRTSNKSGYRGVSSKKNRKKYVSQISIFGKVHHLGYFDNSRDAAIAYDTFVIVYGTQHTKNFP